MRQRRHNFASFFRWMPDVIGDLFARWSYQHSRANNRLAQLQVWVRQ